MTTPTLPSPHITPDARPFWEGAARGELMLQRCTACGHVRFLPAHLCPRCWAEGVAWFAASGRGTVTTFTIVHRAPSAAFAANAPYVVALVDLAEGPRMMANVLGEGALLCAIGDAVEVIFEQRGEVALPQFRLSNPAAESPGGTPSNNPNSGTGGEA